MHGRRLTVGAAALAALAGLAVAALTPVSAASSPAAAPHQLRAPGTAVAAPRWTALFDRTSGWTGADGIYTAPLSGDERPGSATAGERTYFTFSDTFVGEVDDRGHRLPGSTLVNNTTAVLTGGLPRPSKMHFFVNENENGKPTAQVVPNTSPDHWFWPGDAIAVDDTLYEFSLRMKPGDGGAFNFAVDGISLLSTSTASAPPFGAYEQVDTPLYLPATSQRGEVTFGQALMPNTAAAGAPAPDGYLYVYGLQNDRRKKLMAARVLPADLADFSAYRYWNGSAWVADSRAAVPLTDRLSSEFSVTPLADGRYILVFQLDALSSKVAVRYGDSPVGPWTEPDPIWTAPEDTTTPNTYVYNAKAHPHLSKPGELLISYNVNTFSFAEHFDDADIYRPRFIKLTLPAAERK